MFNRDTFRLIRRTFKRFITLTLMVLIGSGFMVGLMSSSPMLERSVDKYNDENNLMDMQIYSSFGFCNEDVRAIEETEGVKEVFASKFVDAYVEIDETSVYVTRLQELDSNINKFKLVEGRMPENDREALVLEGSELSETIEIGSTIKIYNDDDILDNLKYDTYTIVGTVESSQYLAKTLETSTFNNLALDTVLWIDNDNFIAEYYTTVYFTLEGALEEMSYSDTYDELISNIKVNVEDMASRQENYLKNDLIQEAEQEIADAEKTLEEEVADAQKEIADGEAELYDAYVELIDGQKEIDDGWVEVNNNQNTINDNRTKLDDAKRQLEEGRAALNEAKEKINVALEELSNTFYGMSPEEALNSLQLVNSIIQSINIDLNGTVLEDGTIVLSIKDNISTSKTNSLDSIEPMINILKQYEGVVDGQEWETGKEELLVLLADYRNDIENEISITETIAKQAENIVNNTNTLISILNFLPNDETGQIEQAKLILFDLVNMATSIKSVCDNRLNVQGMSLNDYLLTADNIINTISQSELINHDLAIEFQEDINNLNANLSNNYALKDHYPDLTDEYMQTVNLVISQLKSKVDTYIEQINTLIAGQAEIAAREAELNSASAQIDNGYNELNNGQKQIDDAKNELNEAQKEIDDGWAKYYDGLSELEDGKKELEEKREEAEIDIAQARQDIADLPDAEWTVLDRSGNYSHALFDDTVDQMANIGYVFPLLFFLVAALVCLTTMTRLIDEERGQIGIFSALGFSNNKIISKYLIYACIASLVGALIGIPIGMAIYPTIIYNTWELMYTLPEMIIVAPLSVVIIGVLSFTVLMMLVTYFVARKTLIEKPAELMRPKAPKEGKKIFLEKISFIWKNLSFLSKISARNIFRYKSRFLMTVIGVAGCTSLLVMGFGIKDSISDIINIQYSEIFKYTETISLEDDDYLDDLMSELSVDENIEVASPFMEYSSKAYIDDEPVITVKVYDEKDIENLVNLRTREGHEKLSIVDGVVISEKFATNHNLKVGDTITIESTNGIRGDVKISGICELYFEHYLFMSDDTYQAAFNERVHNDKIAIIALDADKLINDYDTYEYITSIVDFSGVIDSFQTMIGALDLIILVIIVAAGSLALVVLINLSEVNISERIREIATFKVLGFYDSEVNSYIFKEIIVLTIVGALIGLPLGKLEHTFVMQVIDMDMIMYGKNIAWSSYLFGFLITMVFTVLVLLIMSRSLKKVKMVESLKSVE